MVTADPVMSASAARANAQKYVIKIISMLSPLTGLSMRAGSAQMIPRMAHYSQLTVLANTATLFATLCLRSTPVTELQPYHIIIAR